MDRSRFILVPTQYSNLNVIKLKKKKNIVRTIIAKIFQEICMIRKAKNAKLITPLNFTFGQKEENSSLDKNRTVFVSKFEKYLKKFETLLG